jgi:hypothetical protein
MQPQQQRRRHGPPAGGLLLLVAAIAAAAAAFAAPRARAAPVVVPEGPVANIQSIHGCDCIGICDRGSAGPHNTPTCYVNVSSCEN